MKRDVHPSLRPPVEFEEMMLTFDEAGLWG